jgi:hypothetical protein
MGLLAATLSACSSDPDKRCVDRDSYLADKGYKVVSDKYCKSGQSGYSWYYGGSSRSGRVGKGSFTKPHKGSGGGGVHRGGFGSGGGKAGG